MKRIILTAIAITVSCITAFSQATIKGKITDKETGEILFGATAGLKPIMKGAAADFDGNYIIKNVPAGTYTVECSYISYETEKVGNFIVEDGKTYTLDFQLGTGSEEIEVVEVVVRMEKNNDNAILMLQKRETTVMDGVSSEQFSKVGAGDAAAAAKKVSGVTVQGGKYVYVRGLGDRYSKTLVNGAEIPGLDPNKNSVQMDMFPTELLDNMLIYKTFQADKPGDYTGGLVDIGTKQYPDKFKLSVSTSAGFNPNAHLNPNVISYDNSNNQVPEWFSNNELPTFADARGDQEVSGQKLAEATKSFDNKMDFHNRTNPLNFGQNINIGNSYDLNDSVTFGFVAAVSYDQKYSAYDNGINARWQLSENASKNPKLNNQRYFDETRGQEQFSYGGLVNLTLDIDKKKADHTIGANFMFNGLNEKDTRFLQGRFPANDPSLVYYTRSLQNQYNKLAIGQLVGEHEIGKSKINWVSSFSSSSQEQPDLRFFTYGDYIDDEDTLSKVDISIGQLPTRYFRTMNQTNWDNKIHFTQEVSDKLQLKFGASGTFVKRDFKEDQYRYANDLLAFDNNVEDHLSNVWQPGQFGGVYIVNAFDPRNTYNASQNVFGSYAQLKYEPNKVSTFIGGLRAEKANIGLVSQDEEVGEATLNNLDILPSLSYIRTINEDLKLKTAATRTLARPTFRELAPYASFQFVGQELLLGNPNLQRTLIDNFDVRLEKYGKPGELVAVSLFGKRFTNPIERIINPFATNEINFANIDKAVLGGVEVEWKKGISALSNDNRMVSAGVNASYIYSRINLTDDVFTSVSALNPNAKSYRQMFGQAPYTMNGIVSYEHFDKGLKANLNFNMSGPKMFLVMKGATPNVFEKSRADLGFNISKELGDHWDAKFSVSNILNSAYRFEQDFGGISYTFARYKMGQTVGMSLTYKIN